MVVIVFIYTPWLYLQCKWQWKKLFAASFCGADGDWRLWPDVGYHAHQWHDCTVHPHWNGRRVHPGEAGHWSGTYVESELFNLRGVLWCNEPTNSFNACRVHYLQDQLHISNTSNRNLWKYSVYHDFGMITRIVFSNKVFDTNYVDFLHYGGVASCVIDKVCCTACLSTFVGTVVVSLDCR